MFKEKHNIHSLTSKIVLNHFIVSEWKFGLKVDRENWLLIVNSKTVNHEEFFLQNFSFRS